MSSEFEEFRAHRRAKSRLGGHTPASRTDPDPLCLIDVATSDAFDLLWDRQLHRTEERSELTAASTPRSPSLPRTIKTIK